MKNFLNKAMLTLVVFGLAIVSSFAMETDPPTEPVKTTMEIEVAEEVQPLLFGYGYKITPTQCVLISEGSPGPDCSPTNSGDICTDINGDLYYMSRATEHDDWVCGKALRKPLVN